LVHLLYDDRYAAAAPYLRLLALTPLLAFATYSANEVLTATGRVHVPFHANIARLAWLGVVGPISWACVGPIGLIACVGGLELPALLYTWALLRWYGLLRLREELMLMGFGLAGFACGYAISGLAGL
jgi:O-antigen/teichoic acid export membrane protein